MHVYAASTSCWGSNITRELADALRRNRMRKLEYMGRHLVEDSPESRESISLLQELVKSRAVEPASCHIPFGAPYDPSASDESDRRANCDRIREIVEKGAELGLAAPNYTLHGGMEPTADDERAHRMKQSKKSLEELVPLFQKLHASVNVELLPRSCLGHDEEELMEMVRSVPADVVGVNLDVNHVMNRAQELPRIIERLSPRLRACHLSDYDGIDEKHWMIPHQGLICWREVMASLNAVPQDLLLIFECNYQLKSWLPTPFDFGIRQCEYAAFYLENLDLFEESDKAFERFRVPGNS